MGLLDPIFATVQSDPIQPREELRISSELAYRFVGPDKHDLRNVFSIVTVVYISVCKPENSIPISSMDHVKRFFGAALNLVAELRISVCFL
jgi:hypothetical protein